MIRHHPEASLAPCDHPMWIIWGRDKHHHALTTHGKARKRERCSSGGAMCPHSSFAHLPAQGSSGGTMCPRGSGTHLPG
jgi:hypothetical protein